MELAAPRSFADIVGQALAASPTRRRNFSAEDRALWTAATTGITPLRPDLPTAFERMFATQTGRAAANLIGNETRTLALVEALSVELMLDMVGPTPGGRNIVVPGADGLPPTLLLLTANHAPLPERIDPGTASPDRLARLVDRLPRTPPHSPETATLDLILQGGAAALLDALWIAQPEIVATRLPSMVALCVPAPHILVGCGGQRSTAGVICRDPAGVLGLTACLHGTGPVGTPVTLGLIETRVTHASAVQDLVFLPLPDGWNIPDLIARAGPPQTRAPGQGDPARFEGATSGPQLTRIMGHDVGLLRRRPGAQLRVQTQANSDQGDSGAALVSEADQLMGFAFERTGYGEFPEFTDWIWADNALGALGLIPI